MLLNCNHFYLNVTSGPSTSTTNDPDSENEQEEEDDLPHKDFVICALDVISALCEGLHDVFSTLVLDTQSHTALFTILFAACNDAYAELRQSGFSLAGEVCKFCFSTLIDVNIATTLVQSAIRNLHIDYPLVCNNAAWCIGNLALNCGGEFLVPFIAPIMHALITGKCLLCGGEFRNCAFLCFPSEYEVIFGLL